MPRASVNWVILDEQFKYVSGGFDMVGTATNTNGTFKNHTITGIPIPKNGYIYVYCSNESKYNVFFDNVQVVHDRGPILEETHYYPFGLTMAGISSKAAGNLENRYKFNKGTELNNDFDLSFYETYCRLYDPQIGRFWQVDELAEANWEWTPYNFGLNNPIMFNDPLGLKEKGPDDPVYTPKTNMEGVTVTAKIPKLNNDQVSHLYYALQNYGRGTDRIRNKTWRAQVEAYDATAKWLEKYHAGVKKDGMMMLNVASWFIPGGQLLKLRYVGAAVNLLKIKRGIQASNITKSALWMLKPRLQISAAGGVGDAGYQVIKNSIDYVSMSSQEQQRAGGYLDHMSSTYNVYSTVGNTFSGNPILSGAFSSIGDGTLSTSPGNIIGDALPAATGLKFLSNAKMFAPALDLFGNLGADVMNGQFK